MIRTQTAPESQEDCGLLLEVMMELRAAAKRQPLLPGLVYTSPYDFVAQHGKLYDGKWDRRFSIGAQKMCFGNAIVMAAMGTGIRYVEGVAVAPDGRVILHAWNVDEEDNLIDTTWANTGMLYLGVEFSVERADDATWNGDAHILNDEHRDYPIYQQRWTGEDYTLHWPYSERLAAIRSRDVGVAWKILGKMKESL